MRTLAILKNLTLTLLLTFVASGVVNAKLASGPQNLGPDLHQAKSLLEPAPRLGWSGSSYDGASESPVVTRGTRSVDDLIKNSKPGRGTKGRTKQFDRSGGLDQANKDFDSLGPQNVREIDTPFGPGRTGRLPDGRQVNIRPGSSNNGPPTLEIQKGKNRVKFRFDE